MATKKKKRPAYRITLMCYNSPTTNRKEGGMLTTAESVTGPSFKCPVCNQTLVYLADEQRLGAHGQQKPGNDKDAPPPGHELRKVAELPQAPEGSNKSK